MELQVLLYLEEMSWHSYIVGADNLILDVGATVWLFHGEIQRTGHHENVCVGLCLVPSILL